jgi:chemotaxis protein MotB
MAESTQQPIVVKKIKKGGGGAHGGAWKLAYADFVTAMMAFFLLMWLLGSTTQADLKGIADYFESPLKVSMSGGSGSGDATSLIPGGGEDLTRTVGQVARSDNSSHQKKKGAQVDAADLEKAERARFEEAKQKIEALIEANPTLRQFKNQLLLDITSEGLRIQIVDERNRPMFDSGAATLKSYTREILHAVATSLNDIDNRISLSGHTDATPYAGGDKGLGNWELSADRANACRREMVLAGLADAKIARVVGLAATVPIDVKNPYAAINRRISIVVMNRHTEEMLAQAGQTLDKDAKKSPADGAENDSGEAASDLPALPTARKP